MPARSNQFQSIIAAMHAAFTLKGGVCRESAMVMEKSSGVLREVDILFESDVAGYDMKIAVECRDQGRKQNLEWIDSLIGKYADLEIDKIVAISTSEFSDSAIRKAKANRIDCHVARDAENVDWASEFGSNWRVMTHKYHLFFIASFDQYGKLIFKSDIDIENNVTHKDEISEQAYSHLSGFFFEHHAKQVSEFIEKRFIEPKWQEFFDGEPKRYCEIVFDDLDLNLTLNAARGDFLKFNIKKFVYGVGVIFEFQQPASKRIVLKDKMIENFGTKFDDNQFEHYILYDKEIGMEAIGLKNNNAD